MLLPAVVVTLALSSLAGCSLFQLLGMVPMGDVRVTFYVEDIPDQLYFDHDLPYSRDEPLYCWRAYIDIDNDVGTGMAPEGFDVKMSMEYRDIYNLSADDISDCYAFFYLYDDTDAVWNIGYYYFGEDCNDPIAFGDAEQNIVMLGAYSNWPELAGLSASSRFQFEAGHYTAAGFITDTTTITAGSGTIIDADDGYPNGFMELLSAKIEY